MLCPSLHRYVRINDHNLYHSLIHPVFLDTMFATAMSRSGNKCTKVCATDFSWDRVHLVAPRNKVHETLSLLFARDSVLLACIHDNPRR